MKDNILRTLNIYKKEYQNVCVPYRWKVPSSDPWPRLLWNDSFGARINRIRLKRIYCNDTTFETQLNEVEFVWSVHKFKFQRLLNELNEYFITYKHLDIPLNYVTKNETKLGFHWKRIKNGHLFSSNYYQNQLYSIYELDRLHPSSKQMTKTLNLWLNNAILSNFSNQEVNFLINRLRNNTSNVSNKLKLLKITQKIENIGIDHFPIELKEAMKCFNKSKISNIEKMIKSIQIYSVSYHYLLIFIVFYIRFIHF